MDRFTQDLNTYLRPLWEAGETVNETLMFVGEEDVGVLLYTPKGKVTVRDYRLEKTYIEGKDYRVEGRKIYRLAGSSIPCWDKQEYYAPTFERYQIGACERICEEMGGQRYLKYGEGDTFTSKQIAVTYAHEGVWAGEIPVGKSEKLGKTLAKLARGERVKFLFYGDSITTGCNASGTAQGANIPPYMPPFPVLVTTYLERKYGVKIELVNTAVGGMNTRWGLDNMEERLIAHAPDLAFVAFGMNDPSTPREEYKETVKQIIENTHAKLPDAEIVLVSSILPNNESDQWWFRNQCVFYQDLLELEKEYSFVCTANVTTMQKTMLDMGKRYRDMTANNINHPNDYAHRLYAQVILKTVLGNEFTI